MNKSFIEKMQESNHGKRGLYIAIGTLALIVIIKLFVTPIVEPQYINQPWPTIKYVVNAVETLVMLNIFAFFAAILFFKDKVGGKIIYAMQLKDTSYFKEKWILWWMRSIWISIIIIGVTTVIKQALFKSWESFFFLLLLLAIPFYLMPKLQKRKFF